MAADICKHLQDFLDIFSNIIFIINDMYNPRISVVFKETRQNMATFETTYQHFRDEKIDNSL